VQDSDFSLLNDAVKHITSALKIDRDRIKATFSFLPPPETDNEILSLAIEKILAKYFKITIGSEQLTTVKSGRPATFEDQSVEGLPARTVNIVLATDHCFLGVKGVQPVNGSDGRSEMFYAWQKEAGVVDEIGNIDLKRTNALTGVKQGDHLAAIYIATQGEPGISVEGKRIKQYVGKALKVKWDDKTIIRTNLPDDESVFHLHSDCSGIAKAVFATRNNPKTLQQLSIESTVTVPGDVNYGIGDQGSVDGEGEKCPFSLEIKGNVKGAFSLQSDGFIHVKGTIEGKTVIAEEITAQLITGRCIATAKETIEADSIVNATAIAKQITVKKNASGSTLRTREKTVLTKKANCVGMTIETKRFESNQNNFTGKTHIYFIQDLFTELKSIKQKIKQTTREANQLGAPNKDVATAMLTDIARHDSVVNKTKSAANKKIVAAINEIKIAIVTTIQSVGQQMNEELVPRCQQLQIMLGEAKYHESLIMKLDTLAARVKKYNVTAGQLGNVLSGDKERKDRALSLEREIKEELIISLSLPQMIGHNAELHVHCGEIEELYTASQIKGNIEIQYVPPKGEDSDISKGKLKLRTV
jgi:hypothetical protein